MKKLIVATSISLTALLAGCSTQSIGIGGQTEVEPTLKETQTFFFSGIGQTQHIDAAKVCEGAHNIIKVESLESPLNIVMNTITFGIYTPRDVKIYCKAN